MHKEIIINSTPNEARVALLEDHDVVEFMMERADNKRAVGNVYKGVVTAVRPGLQAAFVDIGMEKGGFLHVSDLIHDDPGDDDDGRRRSRGRRREGLRPIETMLKEGDEILVQVTKEVIGTKGPRLTADISLPGRFMVLMPKGDHVGVSRKIEDRKERGRLKGILSDLKPDDEAGAFIIRTAAVSQDAKMIERDMQYLRDLWKEMNQKAHSVQAPAVVHEDVGLIVSLIRDIFKNDVDSVVVDNKDDHSRLMHYVKTFSPDLRDRITLYNGDMPIFDKFGIEAELKKSLDKKVWMKRGGFLVIEQTEALVAIDVNTGRFIGKKNQAETIFKTNMLAAKEIARQLRLRDVGGIIVLDFIDMESEDDKRRVLAELRTHLKRDRSRTKSFAISDLGLVEMSRQRVQESLKDRLSDNCPYCNGSGQILSVDTLSNKVERLLAKLAATRNEKAVQVRANPTLALQIMTERANTIQQIERSTGMKIDVVDDARLHREEFQIVSMSRRKDLVGEIEKSDERSGGNEERRGRGDSDRSRHSSGRDREEPRGDSEDSRRRRPRRDEAGDEAPAERSRRGRRRREGDEGAPEREGRPRREQAEDSDRGGDDRSRRRPRRGERSGDDRARRPDDAAEARNAAVSTSAAEGTTHPADDGDEDRPRRRRRRGRRGGRGRRRGRGEDGAEGSGEATGTDAEASAKTSTREDAPSASRAEDTATDERREDRRKARRDERRDAHRDEERHEVADAAPAVAEEAREAQATSGGDEGNEDRPRRRRRRSRRSSSAGERPSPPETTESAAVPQVEAVKKPAEEPVEEKFVEPVAERPTKPIEDAAEEGIEATSRERDESDGADEGAAREPRRRRGRGRRSGAEGEVSPAVEATEPASPRKAAAPPAPGNGVGGQIDTADTYARPVPEGSTEPAEQDEDEIETAAETPARPEPVAAAPDASDGKSGSDDVARPPRRRRRRARSAGTPTRLIGTGKTKDQEDD